MNKQFFSKNIIFILFAFSIIVMVVLSIEAGSFTAFLVHTMEYNTEQRLIAASKIAAHIVSADELNQYRHAGDMSVDSYQALRKRLNTFSTEYGVLYVYDLRRSDGDHLQYIVDSDFNEQTRVGLDTPPDELSSKPWIVLSLEEGKTVCSGLGNYTPGWEGLLSAYSPVFDRERNIVAIAGVDIRDESIVRARRMVTMLTRARIFLSFSFLT